MNRRMLCAGMLVLLSACSATEGGPGDPGASLSTPKPPTTPEDTDPVGADAVDPDQPDAPRESGAGPSEVTPPPAAAGNEHAPRVGTYLYRTQSQGVPRLDRPADGTLRVEVAHEQTRGEETIYAFRRTNLENERQHTWKETWSAASAMLVASGECTPAPPVVLIRFPLRIERYPAQEYKWTGTGFCDGRMVIRRETAVLGTEQVAAAGRTWDTWKIERRTTSEDVDYRETETIWFAPALGMPVKSHEVAELEKDPPATTTKVLESHPPENR